MKSSTARQIQSTLDGASGTGVVSRVLSVQWVLFECLKTPLTKTQTPLSPPSYLDRHGRPHDYGMHVNAPPVCERCTSSPASLPKIQQHAELLKIPRERTDASWNPPHITNYRISIYQPLPPIHNSLSRPTIEPEVLLPFPSWMHLLPSQVNSDVKPPRHSVLQRRRTFPYFESTRYSTPFSTPPEFPRTWDSLPKSVRLPSDLVLEGSDVSEGTQVSTLQLSRTLPKHAPSKQIQTLEARSSLRREQNVVSLQAPSNPPETRLNLRKPSKRLPSLPKGASCKSHVPSSKRISGAESCCTRDHHTPEPTQEIAPASNPKPPLLRELSGFFSSRAGRWILPSRVSGVDHRDADGKAGRFKAT